MTDTLSRTMHEVVKGEPGCMGDDPLYCAACAMTLEIAAGILREAFAAGYMYGRTGELGRMALTGDWEAIKNGYGNWTKEKRLHEARED